MLLDQIRSLPAKTSLLFLGLFFFLYFVAYGIADSNYYIMATLMGVGLLWYLFENAEKTVYLLFLGILFLDWLSDKWFLIPRQITWLPEVLSIIVLLYILLSSAISKKIPFKIPYILVYIFAGLTFLGIILNKVDTPVAIAGIRNHLKFLPFFLLPFYYEFSDDFMEKFVKFLLFFSFLQCPITILQRLLYETGSGDPVGGTLGAYTSGILSLFCSIMIIFWTAYFFKCGVKLKHYLLGLIILFLPMAINETKISLFLIPVIFFFIIFFIPEAGSKTIRLMFLLAFIIILFVTYGVVYNCFYATTTERRIETYVTNPEKIFDYNLRNYNTSGKLNRIPQVIFAYKQINRDVQSLIFGVGAGNASHSFFQSAIGKHYAMFEPLGIDNLFIGNMLWECGIIGTFLYFYICIVVFFKSYSLRQMDRMRGTIAIGFLGISVVLLMSTVYLNTLRVNIFLYLYWFLAGYLMNIYYFQSNDTAQMGKARCERWADPTAPLTKQINP